MKLLYIDDSTTCRLLIELGLSKFDINMAVDGEDGINKIKENEYDIILTDIHMPIKSGVDVLEYVKSNNIKSPIVAMTAFAMKDDEEKYLSLGFDYYITKPISTKQVEKLLLKIKRR